MSYTAEDAGHVLSTQECALLFSRCSDPNRAARGRATKESCMHRIARITDKHGGEHTASARAMRAFPQRRNIRTLGPMMITGLTAAASRPATVLTAANSLALSLRRV